MGIGSERMPCRPRSWDRVRRGTRPDGSRDLGGARNTIAKGRGVRVRGAGDVGCGQPGRRGGQTAECGERNDEGREEDDGHDDP